MQLRNVVWLFSFAPSFGHADTLRSPHGIAALPRVGFLHTDGAAVLFSFLLAMALAAGIRGWYLEYRDRRSIAALAYLERRRARILEDINHSKPLTGILEQITEMVSMRLNGAACWCHVAEGATLGNPPAEPSAASLRSVEFPIAARSGPPLGSLFAAFDARTRPCPEEQETLAMGASLATLAIETSRLYADLLYRSEFDPLTDVENRFVMERKLAETIEAARHVAGIVGLLYIDLNGFKRVNDVYGHMVGDLYLQEMAQRMKGQLRPGDTLARLGGDEFAVLVPVVHSREEIEKIAARLEFCFGEPFVIDSNRLRGSASIGIALYPEDAETAAALLNAADASMYVTKCTQMGQSRAAVILDEDKLTETGRS